MHRLHVYQALWAMEHRRPGEPQPAVAESFDRVKAAGFDGMAIDLGALSFAQAEATVPHFARTGLGGLLTAFPRSIEDLRPALRLARQINAPFVIVVGQVMPLTVADMIPVVREWLRIAAEEGTKIQFETHRNCITNDLFATVQVLDAVPEVRLSADLSHYVVDREMPCPPPPELQALVDRVLARSDSFQGRVGARGQIQIPLHFSQNAKWVRLFCDWWRAGFASWKARSAADATAIFLCELGPPDYALTDANGAELSDRWAEALALRDMARALWDEAT